MKHSHDSAPDDWSWLDELGELGPSFIEAIQQLHAAPIYYQNPERAHGDIYSSDYLHAFIQ